METASPGQAGPRRLVRSRSKRWVAGVAGGLGDYFRVDPNLVRIGMLVLLVFWGSIIPLYLIAWLIIPAEDRTRSIAEDLLGRKDPQEPAQPEGRWEAADDR